MRIRYINPVEDATLDPWFERELAGAGGADATVEVVHLKLAGPGRGAFLPAPASYASPLLAAVSQAEADCCDAAVIGCSGDPCLAEARREVTIPVAAPLDAALRVAAQLGGRLAILVADGFDAVPLYRELATGYGLDHLVLDVLTVNMEYADGGDGGTPEEVLERHRAVLDGPALELAQDAVARGARAVYAGCTLWTGSMLDTLRAGLDVPVLDPGRGAVAMAAAAVRAVAWAPSEVTL